MCQRGLGLIDQGLKRARFAHREIGQDLAVHLDAGQRDALHELGIGQPVLTHARIDPLDPQSPEGPLADAAVAIGVG